MLERAGRGWGVNAMVLEHCLAALVAVAHREGPQELRQLLAGMGPLHSHKLLRSEEHTSELQSLSHLVCRLLLEKKQYFHSFP